MARHSIALVGLTVAALATPALAVDPPVSGLYDSPLGRLRIEGDGTTFTGTLVAPAGACHFTKGDQVLRATLLDDSLAGEVRICVRGAACGSTEQWAKGVLLVGAAGLSGALHVATGCEAPLGRRGGVTFVRSGPGAPGGTSVPAPPRPPAARERARAALRDGAAWLGEGNFERARNRFLEAIEIDDRLPEAYNGVGVTYRMRDDLPAALAWYKKALRVDPDFGDAYYNLACLYALQGQKGLALRYLQIAAVNGYATAEGMDEDPDLATLRDEAAYRALVRAKM